MRRSEAVALKEGPKVKIQQQFVQRPTTESEMTSVGVMRTTLAFG